jgi:glycosyltransferase involved in cell wall biosynthesis
MSQRILHVVSSMDPVLGGVCKAVRTIATSLIESGIENEVVCLDDASAEFIGHDSFKLHALGSSKNPWGYSPKLVPWLKQNLRHFDGVVIHGLWLYSSYAVYLAIKSLKEKDRPKYFVMPHGMLDPYFQKAQGRRLKAVRNWLYWKLIERKVVNHADGLLFTCEEERLLAKKPFKPYHPKKEWIVGLGVEAPPTYHPEMDSAFFERCGAIKNRPFLLFLSRIHEKKGVDLLVKAYETFSVQSKGELPALVIAGPGLETPYGQAIKKMVLENHQLRNHVFFPGMLSGDAKWGAFYNCDAFVLPSHQENFGIAVVEALACGKPVLISNQVNIWREIQNMGAGLVEKDDSQGTVNLIQQWYAMGEDERKSMSLKAKDAFKSLYDANQIASRFKRDVLL